MNFTPIGIYHSDVKAPYEAGRQASDEVRSRGEIILQKGQSFEQALEELGGFERIWLIYQFHHNSEWKPKVLPPRGRTTKVGVFATRAPYRPNPIGISCVKLIGVDGLTVTVEGADLLDQTPILDIKPYLPYADSFPDSRVGWLENIESQKWFVEISAAADADLNFLAERGLTTLRDFLRHQLEYEPTESRKKRVESLDEIHWVLAYKTWRVDLEILGSSKTVVVLGLRSGYSSDELASAEDPYGDKDLHRAFLSEQRV